MSKSKFKVGDYVQANLPSRPDGTIFKITGILSAGKDDAGKDNFGYLLEGLSFQYSESYFTLTEKRSPMNYCLKEGDQVSARFGDASGSYSAGDVLTFKPLNMQTFSGMRPENFVLVASKEQHEGLMTIGS